MKRIFHYRTLFYYDGHQVFEARDAIGGHYIAVLAGSELPGADKEPVREPVDRYLVTGVTPERLRQFRSGDLDLRSLLVESDRDERYLASADAGIDQALHIEKLNISLMTPGLLPDPGFLLHNRPAHDRVLQEARERNKLVIELTAEPPEAASQHRIGANTLAGMLNLMQSVVKYAYVAVTSDRHRSSTDHLLDVVVPAAAGSFRVVLASSNDLDLFGGTDIGRALPRVDMLFEHTADPQATLAIVKDHRGHLAAAYLKLLRFLVDCGTGLTYAWAEPKSENTISRAVSQLEAEHLTVALSSVDRLTIENVVLEGTFERFHRGTGLWGLRTEEGHRSGRIPRHGPRLDGLEVGGRYRFHCDEEIQGVDVTGRETRRLILKKHEPA